MTEPPPAKKLKQCSIFEALRKQASLTDFYSADNKNKEEKQKKTGEEKPDPTDDTMFSTSKGKTEKADDYQSADRTKIARAAEKRAADPSSSPNQTNQKKTTDDHIPSTSDTAAAAEPDSQGSAFSGGELDNSAPLFTDSEDEIIEDIPDSFASNSTGASKSFWRGAPISSLLTTPKCLPSLGKLTTSANHTVLIKVPFKDGDPISPFPATYKDKWDADHVRLPCSPENLYPVEEKKGSKSLKNRWDVVQTALLSDITSSLDLEEAVLTYNTRYSQKWDFRGLHSFFTEVFEAKETQSFFKNTMPKMVELALKLPQLCTQPIPMLKKHMTHSITMSQEQAASLLANAFFCTFPRRNANKKQSEYSTYPDINFNRLFEGSRHPKSHRKAEKLKCLVNYFRRVTEQMPKGTLTFKRQCLSDFPQWSRSAAQLTKLHASATGTIEDIGIGMLQVDFANKFLGGGVLGFGCVQEEIRFLICPELLLSRLFTEVLDRNECLIMTGAERFSDYSGYADSFRWSRNHVDTTPRDNWGRRCTEIVAIDALVFRTYADQFHENLVKRELNKAYCGFLHQPSMDPSHLSAVATGNWGCGAFGGDLRLKALIQLMSAAEAKRDVCYFTFGDYGLTEEIYKIHEFVTNKQLAVSDLFSLIQQYYDNICLGAKRSKKPSLSLYDYIFRVYSDAGADTDSTDQEGNDAEEPDSDASHEVRAHWENKPSPDYAANTP